MKTKEILLSMFLFGSFQCCDLWAETSTKVTIESTEGSKEYVFSDYGKMYFLGNNLIFDQNGDGNIVSINLSNIRKLLFSNGQVSNVYNLLNSSSLSVYPNPCTDFICTNVDGDVKIVNMIGDVFYSNNVTSGAKIDVSFLPSGFYLIIINGEFIKFEKI